MSRCVQSWKTRLIVQHFVQPNSKEISSLCITAFLRGNSPVTGGFPHKRPVMGKEFSCHDEGNKIQSGLVLRPIHDDVIKWRHFPRFWPFVRGIHRSPVNSPHKGQRRGALMFSLFCVWINGWVNNCEAGELRGYRSHYDVTVMRQKYIGAYKKANKGQARNYTPVCGL